MNFPSIALHVPRILLPREGTDLQRWSVIACDQHTSQPEYWEEVSRFVGDAPSTLNLILPESYLESTDRGMAADRIRSTMATYLSKGILVEQKQGFILVDRQTPHAQSRKGLIVSLDLEHYDYTEGAKSLIRATEGTIVDRLPARLGIRHSAPLEVPHIMVLIDDPDKSIIEPLFSRDLKKLYDFDLMMNSGHLTGYAIKDTQTITEIHTRIERLADVQAYQHKYQTTDASVLLYAMGDGNHSLATAKLSWEKIKAESPDKDSIMQHPARFPLVELVNLHDEGLTFEPIHRAVFNMSPENLLEAIASLTVTQESSFTFIPSHTQENHRDDLDKRENAHCLPFVSRDTSGFVLISNPTKKLEVATLQSFLDTIAENTPGVKIDYIHGDETLRELSSRPMTSGFLLKAISKSDFFSAIIHDGEFPHKTFSMGSADEKRFYLECRSLTQ